MSENHGENQGMRVQPHGGALRNGGTNKGGTGRPKSAIRASCADSFDVRIKVAEEIADDPEATRTERLKALEVLGTFGGLKQVDQTSGDQPLKPTSVVTIGSDVPLSDVLAAIEKLEG